MMDDDVGRWNKTGKPKALNDANTSYNNNIACEYEQ